MSYRLPAPYLVLAFVFTLLPCGAAAAQMSITFTVDGPNLLIPNAPFTLRRVTRTESRLQTGSTLHREVREVLTRDAAGSVFDLATSVPDDPLKKGPESYLLGDAVAHTITEWAPGKPQAIATPIPSSPLNYAHFDVRVLWNDTRPSPLPADAKTVTESLGTETIAGIPATGTRTTLTIPAADAGASAPLRFVQERWISNDLQLVLREIDINPFTGTRNMDTEKLDRTAGQAVLFHLPPGLQVKMLPLPPAPGTRPRAAAAPDHAVYNKAIEDLKAPETREAAADTLVQYASLHPEFANRTAHMLAVHNTHLPDAMRLATSTLQQMEQGTAAIDTDHPNLDTDRQMTELAEYWFTLGAVYDAQGNATQAARYYRLAWQLGGEGVSMDHLAMLEARAGDKTAALHDFSIALSGQCDDRETDQITRRAQRLGDAHPQPTPAPQTLPLPALHAKEGAADFALLFTQPGTAPPTATWLSGDPALQSAAAAVAAAPYPTQVPDTGPEHILRRAQLQCTADHVCSLTLLYAWQARQQDQQAPAIVTP